MALPVGTSSVTSQSLCVLPPPPPDAQQVTFPGNLGSLGDGGDLGLDLAGTDALAERGPVIKKDLV